MVGHGLKRSVNIYNFFAGLEGNPGCIESSGVYYRVCRMF